MGFIKLEFPISDPIWGIGTPCPEIFRDREHWWGVSSLNWMKNMGIGNGNTTGGVALSRQLCHDPHPKIVLLPTRFRAVGCGVVRI